MTKTLILLFHPDPSHSKAKLPAVEVVDMQATYPNGIDMSRDGEFEAMRLLKAWQDTVLTRMFEGTPLMVAATADNVPDAYRPGGRNMFTMNALFAPLQSTAHCCGLPWAGPFVLYQADKLPSEALDAAAAAYTAALERWIASSTALCVKEA